jgi:hypothetical protein
MFKDGTPNYQELNLGINTFYVKVQKLILNLQDNNNFSFKNLFPKSPSNAKSLSIYIERLLVGGRYWVRTSDPLLVRQVL